MSVEKIPSVAAHSGINAKGSVGVKAGHGANSADNSSDPGDTFGALLSSLGGDDVELSVANSAFTSTADDQLSGDVISDGGAFLAFPPVDQAAPFAVTAASISDVLLGGFQDEVLPAGEIPSANVFGLTTANSPSASTLPGTKQGFRSSGLMVLGQISDVTGPVSAGTKTARLLKDRGRTEIATAVMNETKLSANATEISKLDLRSMSEKVEFRGTAHTPAAVDLLPVDGWQQTEFRREKAIFKVNSSTVGADASTTNGLEARPSSFNLESLASDVGSGMAQHDQNAEAYWVSSDLKNAEMKLDGFGEGSVEVSVSVHGNQTHVAFRTDDVQTRLAMEDANTALKDMLSNEGLDLAGLSVGTSSAGDGGSHDRRSRQDGRLALANNLADKFPSGATGHIVTRRVGQLDVFV
jgi:hypothetical protein